MPGAADGRTRQLLLMNADTAIYRAKKDGRGTFRFFDAAMDAAVQTRRTLELDLRTALATEQFDLFYQPLSASRSRPRRAASRR